MDSTTNGRKNSECETLRRAGGPPRSLEDSRPAAVEQPQTDSQCATLDDLLGELRLLSARLAAGPPELLDAREAAALLGLSRSTFFRLVAKGKLPKPMKFGKQLRRWSRRALLDAVGLQT